MRKKKKSFWEKLDEPCDTKTGVEFTIKVYLVLLLILFLIPALPFILVLLGYLANTLFD